VHARRAYDSADMCGRFSLTTPVEAMRQLFGFSQLPNLAPRYNIAPTQDVAVVRAGDEGGRDLSMLRWGLIPSWAKDKDFGAKTINARAETVAEKPSFRSAYKKRRCLIPADGYYEWVKAEGGKQPYRFCREDGEAFGLAGLWESWTNPEDGEVILTCSIVVREAGSFTETWHHRMPVIVRPDSYGVWLGEGDPDTDDIAGVMAEPNEDGLIAFPISKRVNNVRYDDAECIEPVELSAPKTADVAKPAAKQGNLF